MKLKKEVLLVLAGAATVLAFAPWQWFIIAFLTPALLERTLFQQSPKKAAFNTFLFGFGFFSIGISWVFLSIHDYSDAPLWAAVSITLLFIAALSAVLALAGAAYSVLSKRITHTYQRILIFPIVWVLFEWVRTWLLTGFPWLLLGYTLIDTPLKGFAPIVGVYGLSFLCTMIGVTITQAFFSTRRVQLCCAISIVFILISGYMLNRVEWTHPVGEPKIFGLVQGNIPQEMKWDPNASFRHLETYRNLTKTLRTSHIIVWPEAAFPFTLPEGFEPLMYIDSDALHAQQSLLTGAIIAVNEHQYTNSLIAVGQLAEGEYDKYHLVPFGEYVPFATLLGSTFDWLQLPMSFTIPGAQIQPAIKAQGLNIGPLICYEVVYPELARLRALNSDVLLTISNDTWFGKSLGPIQHMQMARMRALENGRMLVRATNNGISAIVNKDGSIRHQAPAFRATTLTGLVQAYQGRTPIMWLSHHGIIMMLMLLGLVLYIPSCLKREKKL